MEYKCSECEKREDVKTFKARCECGGLWKLEFSPIAFDLNLVETDTWGLFRYRTFMPLNGNVWRDITLGEGFTPIILFDENVFMKMEYFMPTLSFKDRGAAMLIAHCKSIGVNSVVQDSSGNAGNSIAAYCGKAGIKCEIFVPEGTSPKKIAMIKAHGAKVNIVEGNRDHCADVCRTKVEKENVYYASHVYNPFFYEVYEQLKRIPENLFIPLGNGTLFIGVIIGLRELFNSGLIKKMPNIIAVQSQYCDPIARAVSLNKNLPAEVTPKPTLAKGIAIGQPMRGKEILEYIYKFNITVVTAPEELILEARKILALKGIYCEHTTAATYAAYLKYCEINGKISDCLIPICGAGLKSDH